MHIYLANQVDVSFQPTNVLSKNPYTKHEIIFLCDTGSILSKLTPVDESTTDQVTILKENLNEFFCRDTDGRRVRRHTVEFWRLLVRFGINIYTSDPGYNANPLSGQCYISVRDKGSPGILGGLSQLFQNGELKLTIKIENLQYLRGEIPSNFKWTTISMNITDEKVVYNSELNSYGVEKSVPQLIGKQDDFAWYVSKVQNGRMSACRLALRACITIIAMVPDKLIPNKLSVNKELLHNKVCSDTTIIAKNGVAVECHKAFLTVHSSVLGDLIQTAMQETKVSSVEMPNMSEASVRALLTFLYCGEMEEAENDSLICFELFAAGHKYDIRRLADFMQEILLTKDNDWYDVEVAVKLFLYSAKLPNGNKLKMAAIEVLKAKHTCTELDNCPAYKNIFIDDPEAAKDLCTNFLMLSLNN